MENDLTYKELERMYNDTVKRYDSLVGATQKLELVNGDLVQRNTFLEKQLENAQLQINQQKENQIRVITQNNEMVQEMAVEIAQLRAEIKRLENGNHNRLGN